MSGTSKYNASQHSRSLLSFGGPGFGCVASRKELEKLLEKLHLANINEKEENAS